LAKNIIFATSDTQRQKLLNKLPVEHQFRFTKKEGPYFKILQRIVGLLNNTKYIEETDAWTIAVYEGIIISQYKNLEKVRKRIQKLLLTVVPENDIIHPELISLFFTTTKMHNDDEIYR